MNHPLKIKEENVPASALGDIRRIKISDLQFDDKNANSGTDLGKELLQTSLTKYGVGRGVLADRNLKLIAGNHAVKEMMDQGIEEVIVIPTDGKTLVVTQRMDIDKNSKAGTELAIADNRVSQANLQFDMSVIRELNAEFDLDLTDLCINLHEDGPYFPETGYRLPDGTEQMETSYGEKNISYTNGQKEYVQSSFPLAITLTKAERIEFDNWKKAQNVRTDTDGFLLMFKTIKAL